MKPQIIVNIIGLDESRETEREYSTCVMDFKRNDGAGV